MCLLYTYKVVINLRFIGREYLPEIPWCRTFSFLRWFVFCKYQLILEIYRTTQPFMLVHNLFRFGNAERTAAVDSWCWTYSFQC